MMICIIFFFKRRPTPYFRGTSVLFLISLTKRFFGWTSTFIIFEKKKNIYINFQVLRYYICKDHYNLTKKLLFLRFEGTSYFFRRSSPVWGKWFLFVEKGTNFKLNFVFLVLADLFKYFEVQKLKKCN